jgi:5-methylcytosine-specific restriction enzyme A
MAKAAQQHKRKALSSAHATPKHITHDKARGSARDRGYTTEWDKFSKAFLASHVLCEYCTAKGLTVVADVTDHDLPHRQDPDLFWNNTFTALCRPCHNSTKARLEVRLSGDALLAAVRKLKGGGRVKP